MFISSVRLLGVMIFLLACFPLRAEVTFTPAEPVVAMAEKLTLSVSGTVGELTWSAQKGRLDGTGTTVTYIAPSQPGWDAVMVMDAAANVATVKIQINAAEPKDFSVENAVWEIFTNRDWVQAFALSKDKATLWVGTNGGLEKRNASTGELDKVYTNTEDLPDNEVEALLSDDQGGVWIGTGGGIAHLKADGSMQVFNKDNSNLPENEVDALFSDQHGGVWIGTTYYSGSLAHLKADGSMQIFNKDNSNLPEDNSNLPENEVYTLISDEQGDVWVGTGGGVAHLKADGSMQVFNTDNSDLPDNYVKTLIDDEQGGVWVGTWLGSLAHLKADGSMQIFNKDNSNLPEKNVTALLSDEQGGVWVGTYFGGIAHFKADGSMQVFQTDNSNLPYNWVKALLSDEQGGIWVGTLGGIAHLKKDGSWLVFNEDNSNLPSNSVYTLLSDEQGGVWVKTASLLSNGGGIAHLKSDGSWQDVFGDNSNLPLNYVTALIDDEQGGIWVGTYNGGIAHKKDSAWQVFNKDNSNLPDNDVKALISDEQGGVWVGTIGGLAHFKKDGSMQVFQTDNSNLPENDVEALLSDEQGGVWVGTTGGLAHLKQDGSWQVLNTDNFNLPENEVEALLSDEQGGVWVGTTGGLAHLTPGEQQSGKRAAIIIAGGGNRSTNALWDTTESISTYFYQMLQKRKFVNSEIYYLSSQSWADFNGDGFDDRIVDAPRLARSLTLNDIKQAFEWAKAQGKLDQPLYLFFIDHGGVGKLQLAKNTTMSAEELKGMLDDYQQATGNQVVILLEASYSGSFLPLLAAPDRAIISSAKGNELAYFENKQGFSRFFTQNLLKGMNFLEAFEYGVQKQNRLLARMDERLAGSSLEYVATTQTPQCDDNGDGVYDTSDGQRLKQLRINGDIQMDDLTLAVESLTASSSLRVGEPFSLRAKASTASGQVKRVWAVIRPPRINMVIDSNGTPILAYPTQALSQTEDADVWAGIWSQALYNGDYEISFYAKDKEGNIEMSEASVVISVNGGVELPATASVEVVIEKDRYARGKGFKFELVEQLGWGYDLYAAVVLPDGQFITLKGANKFAPLNQPENWRKSRKFNENVMAIDLTIPADLATGTYCLYGILSPQKEDPMAVMDKWVYSQKCFEVF
jgi:ligand-binding sensor domain-containing protein